MKTSAAKNVKEYFEEVAKPARGKLREMRAAIRSAVPRGSAEVISYGIPAFKQERVIVWYAGFSKHVSLFPTGAIVAAFRKELKGYTVTKGTIHFLSRGVCRCR